MATGNGVPTIVPLYTHPKDPEAITFSGIKSGVKCKGLSQGKMEITKKQTCYKIRKLKLAQHLNARILNGLFDYGWVLSRSHAPVPERLRGWRWRSSLWFLLISE